MRRNILSPVVYMALPATSTTFHKAHNFQEKKLLILNYVF